MAGLIDLQQTGYSLVLGGARSGKSAYAEAVIEAAGGGFYVATSEALDDEMKARIETHKARRGDQWQTLEEPILLEHALRQLIGRGKPALVDCLTLWLSNLMELEKNIDAEIDALCALVDDLDFPVVFVSGYAAHPFHARRPSGTGMNRNDPDAVAAPIDCRGSAQTQQTALGTSV